VYRVFQCAAAQYTLLGTFSKIDHNLRQKASLNKYKKIEISPCIITDHNIIKLELKQQKTQQKICKQLEAEQYIAQ
jgi:hypothetical protein